MVFLSYLDRTVNERSFRTAIQRRHTLLSRKLLSRVVIGSFMWSSLHHAPYDRYAQRRPSWSDDPALLQDAGCHFKTAGGKCCMSIIGRCEVRGTASPRGLCSKGEVEKVSPPRPRSSGPPVANCSKVRRMLPTQDVVDATRLASFQPAIQPCVCQLSGRFYSHHDWPNIAKFQARNGP